MSRARETFFAARQSPGSISFADLLDLIETAGFSLDRIRGSHRVFRSEGILEIINVQPDGNKAKDYQVRQVLDIIAKYSIPIP